MTGHVLSVTSEAKVLPSKRVCVVGAGASGLATLKVLAETRQVQSGQWSVVAFEERDNIGGIWYPAPPSDDPPLTPLYDSLRTNLPHVLMAYRSFPFPPETALYPTASVVQRYLEDYATHFDLLRYVRLCTRVDRAFWDRDAKEWEVTLSTGEREMFDFVVVANGRTRKPRYPIAPGLQHWLESGRAIHSAWYRRPGDLAHHKKVMVVGGGPSAIDICKEMDGVGPLLLHSIPGPTYEGGITYSEDTAGYRKVCRVREYRDDETVVLVDGSTESDIDLIIIGTGYEVSIPFLPQIKLEVPTLPPPLPNELYNSTYHVFPLAYQLFPLRGEFPPASIAFTGLPSRVSPIPIFEDQAQAIVRVLGDPGSLDSLSCTADVVERALRLISQEGIEDPLGFAKAWMRFGTLEPFEYRAELNAFAGKDWTAPDWEIEFWTKKNVLRKEWNDIEGNGKSEEWLKGVGLNGVDDWVGLCRRLINRSI
ncbi:FAD/NAD(P)-binding domain-containing protein [Lactarius indigo]|nr:FAD/NAD(P)-binding domain-containing protein [Lactarius indigo]